MSKVLVIDNYDSFTFNLVNYFKRAGAHEVVVARNDEMRVEDIIPAGFTHVVISPGPGSPDDAGISMQAIKEISGKLPILGVCLGLQSIVQAFGGHIIHASSVMHGKIDTVMHDGKYIFRTFTGPLAVARYHSLAAQNYSIPDCLEITARSLDGEIMGVRHKEYAVEGVQFHPESVGTPEGMEMIRNFLNDARARFSIKECLQLLSQERRLGRDRALFVAQEISNAVLKETQTAALLMGITARGITEDELEGFAQTFYAKADRVQLEAAAAEKTIDIVGTGGDSLKTCNISTLASLTLGAMLHGKGYAIAKHGNRSVSSSSGSSDVLSALGYPVDAPKEAMVSAIAQSGFGFFFAPRYHPAFKNVASIRKDLGAPTILNYLGPIINPTNLKIQLIGVSKQHMCEAVLKTALRLGRARVWVVRGEDDMDEVSVCAPSEIYFMREGAVEKRIISAPELGLQYHNISQLVVSDAQDAAQRAKDYLHGKASDAITEAVCANAGLAHALALSGNLDDAPASVALALKTARSGAVWKYFEAAKAAAVAAAKSAAASA